MANTWILERGRYAVRAAGWHLLISVVVAALAAALVFGLWYPGPYRELSGGSALFLILMGVDVICGPLLTLVLLSPQKSARQLRTDVGLVALVQLFALCYGLHTMMLARPVVLAFELDRFRVVAEADIQTTDLVQAPKALQNLSLTGPALIAVKVARAEDADYLTELDQSLSGLESSMRPARWLAYESQIPQVLAKAKPLAVLKEKYPDRLQALAESIESTGLPAEKLVWLPIRAKNSMAWVALLDKDTAKIAGYAPFDGF